MDDDLDPVVGLLETYEAAIIELESWNDPAVATLLASLKALRQRAREHRAHGDLADELATTLRPC